MASVFVKHGVSDFDSWKKVFDEHLSVRQDAGLTAHSLHRDSDDPNVVIIAFRAKDIAQAKAFTQSDNLREIMQNAGVTGPPEFWFADDVEEKTY